MLRKFDPSVFFIHVPKCGGTTVSRSLRPFMDFPVAEVRADLNMPGEGQPGADLKHPVLGAIKVNHLPMWAIAEHFPRTWAALVASSSFVVVREPRDRFVSAVLQRLREYKGLGASSVSDKMIIDEADLVCNWISARDRFCNAEFAHFIRQSEYCEHDGKIMHDRIFSLDELDKLYVWLHETHGFPFIQPETQRVGRRPRSWMRPIHPVARFTAKTLLPRKVRDAIYPLWLRSGAFVPTSSGYRKIDLGKDVEQYVANYYRRDAEIYKTAPDGQALAAGARPALAGQQIA